MEEESLLEIIDLHGIFMLFSDITDKVVIDWQTILSDSAKDYRENGLVYKYWLLYQIIVKLYQNSK